MNKKKKLIVRIISGLLCVLMVLGVIIPYVSATEMTNEITTQETDVNDDETIIPMPESPLPIGFEYVQSGNSWRIAKSEDNTDAAVMLDALPTAFDQPVITIFVGNLATHEVQSFDLYYAESYVASIPLEDGYYVIFANDYAWSDKDGNTYAINNGEFQYIYIGDEVSSKYYGIEFQSDVDIFSIELGASTETMQVIEYGSALEVTDRDLRYPESAKLEELEESLGSEYKPPVEDDEQDTDVEQDNEEQDGFFSVVVNLVSNIMKDSGILIIAAVICGVALYIVRTKKRIELEKQTEIDKLDDNSIE